MNRKEATTYNEIIELKYWASKLHDIIEKNKGYTPPIQDDWLIDCESLLIKEFFHCLTVLDLTEGTKPSIQEIKTNINFIDYISISVITRSALETYLVLAYVFIDKSANKRTKKLRHKIWHASSLSQRQKQVVKTPLMQDILKREKTKYLKLRREILSSSSYENISLPEANKLDKKKAFDWKPQDGWRGIASTLLSEKYWVDIYNYLSSIAHSNAVISNHFTNKDKKRLSEEMALIAINQLNLIVPLFIEGYAEIFPHLKSFIGNDITLKQNIEIAKSVIKEYS